MPFKEIKMKYLINEISFSSNGSLRIPKELFDKYTTKKHLKVWVDEESKLIGLEPVDNGYTVSFHPRNSAKILSVKIVPLLRFLKKGRYPIKWDEQQTMFIVNYNKEKT